MRYANRICVGVLAVLVAMSFAGCAQRSTDSPASTTSVGVDTQEGSLMNSVRTEFTPKALRAYVEYVYGDKAGRFLGSAVVEGRKTVPIAEVDGAPATASPIIAILRTTCRLTSVCSRGGGIGRWCMWKAVRSWGIQERFQWPRASFLEPLASRSMQGVDVCL